MNTPLLPEHGGPDGGLPITHDFSTNANPLGPPPALLQAVLLPAPLLKLLYLKRVSPASMAAILFSSGSEGSSGSSSKSAGSSGSEGVEESIVDEFGGDAADVAEHGDGG